MDDFILKLEKEISLWSDFRRALRGEDRKYFDHVVDLMRCHPKAIQNKDHPLLMPALFMSVLLEQERQLEYIEKKKEFNYK
ncbi:MAG: hypothetical protein EAX96_05705 [Candidatus Lokiarchaeota archaeon]|nr:hypothetical protein [Candidatus Lokiarchaeota archaeon]